MRIDGIPTRTSNNGINRELWIVALLSVLHLPLGILFYNSWLFGVFHSLSIFGVGLYFAFQIDTDSLNKAAYTVAYLAGVEVLWRMAESVVFWEFGKYAASLIMLTAIFRRGSPRVTILPLVYFALLVPACILTLLNSEWLEARSEISSNISGPFSLFVSCWFFSQLEFNWLQVRRFMWALIIPSLSVGATTFFYTVSTADISFNTESNIATSGGFGPNQVSSILGLGAFCSLTCLILMNNHFKYKIYFGLTAIFLAAQSVMTFSRGGMYNVIGGIIAVILIQALDVKKALKTVFPLLMLTAIFLLFIFPILDNFTGGLLQQRFEDTGTTNRAEIVETDLEILFENPVFGVGVGEAKQRRREILQYKAASHTEFARLVSEHGLFGVAAITALLLMTIINFSRQESIFGKALIIGLVTWSSLYMFGTGMRLAIPALLWGFSFISIVSVQKTRNVFQRSDNFSNAQIR